MVSEISESERLRLLEQMQSTEEQLPSSLQATIEQIDDSDEPFEIRIKKESLFLRLLLWLKAFLSNTTKEIIYNEYKLAQISKNVHKVYPGLINSKQNLLLVPFYNQISDLKACADFFRPYFVPTKDNEGSFYVFLSTFIMPEVTSDIKSNADPFSNPITPEVKPEMRTQLIRKLEEIFDTIPAQDRARMYFSAKAFEWLRQFVKLPFSRAIAKFSSVNERNFYCNFDQLDSEITAFVSILCNSLSIPDEFLEALYMFSLRNSKREMSEEEGRDAGEFISQARSNISKIQVFMDTVPIRSLGCLIHNDYHWHVNLFSAGEDWFVKYKNTWKKIFEQQWTAWESECRKQALLTSLKTDFQLSSFPRFPERPWENLWNGLPFTYDTTLGFLNWFLREQFSSFEIDLKTVLVQGSFSKTENHTMLSDTFNSMVQLSISFQNFERKLSVHGELGGIFRKIEEERSRTLQAQNKVEQMMREIESDSKTLIHRFGEAARNLCQILSGILGLSKDPRFDTVTNLNKLTDKKNEPIIKKIEQAHASTENALHFLMELEQIDRQTQK